jgi:DEAD/DEAH box helicase domain-containing protein
MGSAAHTKTQDSAVRTPADGPSSSNEGLLAAVVASLGATPVSVERLPARSAEHQTWPDWANQNLVAAFQSSGIETPWRHQMQAAELIHRGHHTVVSTGTASGKSLAYLLPALTDVVDDSATVLYVTPTKALAQDQLKSINSLAIPGIAAATYDGDTPTESRPWLRQHSSYVLTNPEMIHRGILPNHASWHRFFKRLRYLILDEAHQYRGVFGTHMSAILRRLRRVAHHYGSDPVLVAVSATMAEPGASASALFGLPVETVTVDTSSRGNVSLILADPVHATNGGPDSESGYRSHSESEPRSSSQPPSRSQPQSPLPSQSESHPKPPAASRPRTNSAEATEQETSFGVTANVLAELTRRGARTLGFIKARKGAEALAEAVRGRVGEDLRPTVTAYRGGLLPEERREVERRLKNGELRTVATTNALELGVDISGLDAVVVCGWPGTRASFLQQVGRAGRNGEDALAVLVAADNPLDRYLVSHPARILADPLETSTFDPSNPHVLLPHLAAAVAELPFTDDPEAWFGASAPDLLRLLASRRWVRRRAEGWYWTARHSPWELADLRGAGRGPVAITETGTGRLLGTVDESSAPAHVHPGAVYQHLGATYTIESLDLAALVAIARPDRPGFTTHAKSVSDLRVTAQHETHSFGLGRRAVGDVEVTGQVVGFARRSSSGQFLGHTPLDMPETVLNTRAIWWHLPDDVLSAAGIAPKQIPGAVHAAEHASIGILPGLATCDRWDLGGLSSARHLDTGEATVFVYDGHAGGAGIAQHGFNHLTEWLTATREVIATCPCATGCPGCVQSPKCGNGNEPLDKAAAVVVLNLLLQ